MSQGTYRIVTSVPVGRILSTGRALWARPVRQGFCPRPPPAGQYVLYTPLTVYRISGMLYYYNTLEQYFRKFSDFRKILVESMIWRDRNLKFGPNYDLEEDNLEKN